MEAFDPTAFGDKARGDAARALLELHADDDDQDPAPASPPAGLPDDFWMARPILSEIRAFARWRRVSPDALLLLALARSAVCAPRGTRVKTCPWEGPTPLALNVVVVAPSGTGKSKSARAARALIPTPEALGDLLTDQPIGSGEGLAEAFMGLVTPEADPNDKKKPTPVRQQVRHRVHFHVDEGEALTRLVKRDAATLGETLRRAFTGETLGQVNANSDRTRVVKDYTLCVTLCATAGVVGTMLAHRDVGLPQRFLWASAVDPDAPRSPLRAEAPDVLHPGGILECCGEIADEIDAINYARLTGQETADELDSHLILIRARVAAVLAGWECRTEVRPDDWRLAGMICEASSRVRAAAIETAKASEAEELAEKGARNAAVAEVTKARLNGLDSKLPLLAARVGRKVQKAGADGCTRRALHRGCFKAADAHLRDAAIEAAIASGFIVAAGDTFQPGKVAVG